MCSLTVQHSFSSPIAMYRVYTRDFRIPGGHDSPDKLNRLGYVGISLKSGKNPVRIR